MHSCPLLSLVECLSNFFIRCNMKMSSKVIYNMKCKYLEGEKIGRTRTQNTDQKEGNSSPPVVSGANYTVQKTSESVSLTTFFQAFMFYMREHLSIDRSEFRCAQYNIDSPGDINWIQLWGRKLRYNTQHISILCIEKRPVDTGAIILRHAKVVELSLIWLSVWLQMKLTCWCDRQMVRII